MHDALPAVDASAIDLSATFLGRELRLPLLISGMTGGHERARGVNQVLASAAERSGVAFGLGSQRAALRDRSLIPTYTIARDSAPTSFIIANVGISQLVPQDGETALSLADVREIIDMVRADALAVHLNYLEESVQPEGQTRAAGAFEALTRICGASPVPVVAKETGAGITREVAQRLRIAGIRAIDVGGLGGTSFAALEARRADMRGDEARTRLGVRFTEWGVPTAVAVAGCVVTGLPVIATGGVRSGLDAAKALALGASIVGVARPLLRAALEGEAAVLAWIDRFALELRTATFLSGQRRARDLHKAERVVTGRTHDWLVQLRY